MCNRKLENFFAKLEPVSEQLSKWFDDNIVKIIIRNVIFDIWEQNKKMQQAKYVQLHLKDSIPLQIFLSLPFAFISSSVYSF